MIKPLNIKLSIDDIPSLNQGGDFTRLKLTPKEGFVLSRVDGKTSIGEISSISDVPIEEVFEIFSKLTESSAVSFKGNLVKKPKDKHKDKLSILDQLEEDEDYDNLKEIPRDERRKILMMEGDLLKLNYYEFLNLERDFSLEKLKDAYFKLTKEFHPDRFFGKELGVYKKKLEKIFQKITDAFETLSDKDKKREYDIKTFPNEKEKLEASKKDESGGRPKTLIERLASAKQYFALGEEETKTGNTVGAASYYQLAISFDPANQEYKKALEKSKPALYKKRGKSKYEEGKNREESGDVEGAIDIYNEALEMDPGLGECNHALARLLLFYKNDYVKSKEYCLKAIQTHGDKPEVRLTMGMIYKRAGLIKNAVREFKLVLKLDKENKDAKMELEDIE